MFTKKIIDSDAFLDMPLSAQALYFHLNMRADDDGFINNPKKIQRFTGSSDDDLKLLLAKRFVLAFESGVVVIKHWRMHNLLRKDRYHPTQYQEELKRLEVKANGSYTDNKIEVLPDWHPTGTQLAPEDSIGKDSIDKNIYISIIEYLNEKAGTKYRTSSKKTHTCIHARLAEGFTEEDFKRVIDNKCASWIGTEWEKFIRPETLFGTKFEGYLNERPMNKKPVNNGMPIGEDDPLDGLF